MERKRNRIGTLSALLLLFILFTPTPTLGQSVHEPGARQGRRQGQPQGERQGGSRQQGPTAVFHTDVPERIFDVTLARPTDSSVTVVVTARQELQGSIEYGTTSGMHPHSTPLQEWEINDPVHIVLSSLEPNTRYYYRLRYQAQGTPWKESSDEFTFHTQRPSGEPFCFTLQADSHLDGPTDAEVYLGTLQNAADANPDFHIDLGDTFMTDKYGSNFRNAEKQYWAQRFYFGQLCHSAPLFLTLGNHDGEAGWSFAPREDNISVWSHHMRTSLFPNPVPDEFYSGNESNVPGVGQLQNYYAWSWGDAQFVVLDPFWSTTARGRAASDGWRWTLGREQYDWFQQTLQSSDAKFKFVFIHNLVGGGDESARGGAEASAFFEWGGCDLDGRYVFDQKRPELAKPIHDLLIENDVSIVFHGHDHFYARQERDGLIYQLVPQPAFTSSQRFNSKPSGRNTGGVSRGARGAERMASEYGYESGVFLPSPGCLKISVSPSEATVDYLLSDGNTLDTTVAYSYTLAPGLNRADENSTQNQLGDSPSQ